MKLVKSLLDAAFNIMSNKKRQRIHGSPIPGHVIVGKDVQPYLTGQKRPSFRPVYKARWEDRSKYQPHQSAQECARRRRQLAAGII